MSFKLMENKKAIDELIQSDAISSLAIIRPYGLSGVYFLCEIMNRHTSTIVLSWWHFHEALYENGDLEEYINFTEKPMKKIPVEKIKIFFKKYASYLFGVKHFDNHDELISLFTKNDYLVVEIFKIIAIIKYFLDGKPMTAKSLCLVFDPHTPHVNYENLVSHFNYCAISSYRYPITRFARCISENYIRNFDDFIMVIFDPYTFVENIEQQYKNKFYVVKFEDLKMQPEQTLKSLCKFLGLSYEIEMLNERYNANTVYHANKLGEKLTGFDTQSIFRNIDDVVPVYDRFRLEIVYDPLIKYYKYDSFRQTEYDIKKYNNEDITKILCEPYHFEKVLNLFDSPRYPELKRMMNLAMIKNYKRKSIEYHQVIWPESK